MPRLSDLLRALHLKRRPIPIRQPVQFIWGGWDDALMDDGKKPRE